MFDPTQTKDFTVDVEGDTTHQHYHGKFTCKVMLSHRDQLLADETRRRLLGEQAEGASPRALSQAEAFSQLAVRLTGAPSWWQDADNGVELYDENVVVTVYDKCMTAAQDYQKALADEAEEARKQLRKMNPSEVGPEPDDVPHR